MPRCLAVVLLILLLPSLTLADDYRVVPIHQLGTKTTVVRGINDQGELVGASTGHHGISEAFVFTGLGFIPFAIEGAVETTPTGLSAMRIVGSATDALFVVRGFVDDRATGEVRPLTTPDGRTLYAEGVNEVGDIVGHDVHLDTTVHGAILWANGDFTSIDIAGASLIGATDINASGVVVGDYTDANVVQHGFVWADGQVTPLDIPGALRTAASGINDAGQIVGWFGQETDARGFVMEGTDLHLLDVTTRIPVTTLPTGINNHGQVVGTWARVHTLGFVAFPQDTP